MACWCVSAKSGAASNAKNVRRGRSRTVAGIDANVALCEITGPETRPAFPFAANREANGALRLIQFRLQIALRKWRRQTRPAHRNTLEVDICFPRIERHTRIPCC